MDLCVFVGVYVCLKMPDFINDVSWLDVHCQFWLSFSLSPSYPSLHLVERLPDGPPASLHCPPQVLHLIS